MKRKLLNGFMLATALLGVGALQSCKDYEADFQNEWKQQNYTLEEEIALLKSRVGDLERLQALCQQRCDARFQEIFNMLGYWNYEDNGTITQTIKDLIDKVNGQMTDEQLRDFIYRILIERGWGAGEDGKPAYIDIPGMQDKLLAAIRDIAYMQVKINDLGKQIQDLKDLNIGDRLDTIEAWIRNHNDATCPCGKGWTEEEINELIKKQIDALKLIIDQDLSSLRTYVDEQDEEIKGMILAITNTINALDSRLTQAEANAITALNLANQNYASIQALSTIVTGLQGAVDALEQQVGVNTQDIAVLRQEMNSVKDRLDTLEEQYKELDGKFNILQDKVAEIEDQVDTNTFNINKLLELVKTLATQEDLNALAARVAANEQAIQTLQGQVMQLFNIYNRLNKLITGIIIQGVYNPLFGNFTLPIGVQNQMLINYYGQYDGVTPLTFPSLTTSDIRPMLTEREVTNLGSLLNNAITIQNGEILMDGNMGKVYLTINPSNIELDGVNLTLESSDGTESRVQLQNVTRSWENLTFGGTRASENGFYEADAVLPLTAGAINNTNLKLDPNLKGAVKDILNDRSRATVFNLMKAVYGQINQNLPRLGVKSTWKADDGQGEKEYSVLSDYGIAAVTFRPLSYNTFAGQSIDHRFKHHGPIGDVKDYLNRLIKNDKYHFSIDKTVVINSESIKFHFQLQDIDLRYNPDMKLEMNIGGISIVDEGGKEIGHVSDPTWVEVSPENMQDFLDAISFEFNKEDGIIAHWNKQMEDSFKDSVQELCDLVADEISDKLADLEININDQIDKILNDLKSDIAGKTQGMVDKLNRFLELYNDAVDKLNDFMADPNHYLQVAMVYTTGGGNLHRLSTDPKDPTILKMNGGNGVQLIGSSYTAEVAAPAYKKFVAISDAWQTKNPNNHLTPAEIQDLNTSVDGSVLGKVMTGRAKRFGVPTKDLKQGYTYQIVYTAVDFHGYTSTERYYIRLK